MADLLTLVRENDLPPKWDGHPVEWAGWQNSPVIVCTRVKREPCPGCGSRAERVHNRGMVVVNLAQAGAPRIGRARFQEVTKRALYAFRCPDCLLDTVWDMWSDEWWDLDHTDYGPEGSNAP